jgi:hypothetical protein
MHIPKKRKEGLSKASSPRKADHHHRQWLDCGRGSPTVMSPERKQCTHVVATRFNYQPDHGFSSRKSDQSRDNDFNKIVLLLEVPFLQVQPSWNFNLFFSSRRASARMYFCFLSHFLQSSRTLANNNPTISFCNSEALQHLEYVVRKPACFLHCIAFQDSFPIWLLTDSGCFFIHCLILGSITWLSMCCHACTAATLKVWRLLLAEGRNGLTSFLVSFPVLTMTWLWKFALGTEGWERAFYLPKADAYFKYSAQPHSAFGWLWSIYSCQHDHSV